VVGETVSHYRVLDQVGVGGMGVVYKAEDTRLGRLVALKFLPGELAADAAMIERFQREARTASALNHPHICTIYEVGDHNGRPFIAMELLEGETLRQRLASAAIPVATLIDLGLQMVDALVAAHSKGIVHRDIKPANVFVTGHDWIKLLDFGLAKMTPTSQMDSRQATALVERPRDLTGAGVAVGTLAYMSPEQTRGEALDARTDIFSLGAVFYEMATGRQAFADRSLLPSDRKQKIQPALERIIARSLEADRDVRYQSMADLRADLKRLQRDLGSGLSVADTSTRPARPRKGIASLAVLPLVNASGDPEADYLSEGIAESLINSFAELPKLRVAQRFKSFYYAGPHVDASVAARQLGVQAVLTGRIVKRGDTLVMKMELIDVERDAQVWGQQYSRHMADIFALQDEIADEVLDALKVKLAGEPRRRVVKHTTDTDAYHAYLRGRFYWEKRTPDHVKKALVCFERAIEVDPNYALAYAGVADCYAMLGFYPYGVMKPKDAYPRAKAAAQKALVLDGSLGDAHASLGLCAFLYDWDWNTAEREFRRSIEMAPNAMGARIWYPALLVNIGRHDVAIREARHALEIDPLSVNAITTLGQTLYAARRYEEASGAFVKALEMDASFPTAIFYVGLVHMARREYAEAAATLERAVSLVPHPLWIAGLGQVYGLAGRHDEARRILGELEVASQSSYVSPFSFALVYGGLQDMEGWRRAMQACVEERSGLLMWLYPPVHDCVRAHPYFQELVRVAGLHPAVAVVHE
jgi:serine/threonine protein kinase/Tfp pilus assembly protein PilF